MCADATGASCSSRTKIRAERQRAGRGGRPALPRRRWGRRLGTCSRRRTRMHAGTMAGHHSIDTAMKRSGESVFWCLVNGLAAQHELAFAAPRLPATARRDKGMVGAWMPLPLAKVMTGKPVTIPAWPRREGCSRLTNAPSCFPVAHARVAQAVQAARPARHRRRRRDGDRPSPIRASHCRAAAK